jgi:predicted DNA-binding transcriptional regulator AlpA
VAQVEFNRLPDDALIRLDFLVAWGLIPFSRSTLWRKVRQGVFPAPVRVSSQVTAWRCKDVRAWLENPSGFVRQQPAPTNRRPATSTTREDV